MIKKIFSILAFTIIFSGCTSVDSVSDQLTRTTSEIRLENIRNEIGENPVRALNLIFIYKEVYSVTQNDENEDWALLAEYEREAAEALREMQSLAVSEERWDDAVSLGRSLASIGIATDYTGMEAAFILEGAKKMLADENVLGAFLAAVRSHEMTPMDAASASLFLEKAVEARQRSAAAFFFAAAQRAGSANVSAGISDAAREYASGRDSVSDMLKGVATVWVDRGYRIERGMGFPDRSIGSAFFIDSSGLLITNYHVIESEVDPAYRGYSRMYIRMGDSASSRIPARVIGWDKALDLALIKAEIEPEYVFSLVDRVIPRVGDTVLAIGSPIALERTVTSGIVSALGRRFLQIGDVIQIDASVNQGNSGGPLINNEGRLVGVVFAGYVQFQGLNFAVPAETLCAALPAMMKGGKAQRPWLGIIMCETFDGAEILYTAPNTPASMHRINEGSFLKSINGRELSARQGTQQGSMIPAMQREIFLCGPGELVAIETADSEGTVKRHIVMTAARPDIPLLEASRIENRERIVTPLFGLFLTPLQSGLFTTSFRVERVVRGSTADEAGISENDPVTISRLRIQEDNGIAVLEITVKKRRMGYLETSMHLPAFLDTPDTL